MSVTRRFGALPASSPACFYAESIFAIIEVKTTLTNQDLIDVYSASRELSPLPFFVFAFDSQVSLHAISLASAPENVFGIYTLSHGCVVRCEEGWRCILPSQRLPLEEFYLALLDVLALEESLQGVVFALRKHLIGDEEEEEDEQQHLDQALHQLDLNRDP
jgi:hypothetical protein